MISAVTIFRDKAARHTKGSDFLMGPVYLEKQNILKEKRIALANKER